MASEKMYDLAFQYKAIKLWKLLYDDELFAVRLSDGETGYCCVMGMRGEHIALSLYVGEDGYFSYRAMLDDDSDPSDYIAEGEMLTSQNCLQCSFENKDMLSDEELEEVRRYAKAHEKPLRGKNAFPQFTKYQPGKYPWHYDSDADERRICEALSAAIALSGLLREYTKQELQLLSLREGNKKLPLLSYDGDRWIMGETTLPEGTRQYPVPVITNEVLTERLRRTRKKGTWECGTMRLPAPVQEKTDKAPYFPMVLVAVNQEGYVFPPMISDGENAAKIANTFAEKLLETSCPKAIRAGDGRCFAILQDLCKKAGIHLAREDQLETLDEIMQALFYGLDQNEDKGGNVMPDPEELEQLYETLMVLRDGELKQMPTDMANMLLDMADWGFVPEELSRRLRKLFR